MDDYIVISNKLEIQHRRTWQYRDDAYWFQRLVEEVGELGAALAGDHDDPPEWELAQIAAIARNWLRKKARNEKATRIQS